MKGILADGKLFGQQPFEAAELQERLITAGSGKSLLRGFSGQKKALKLGVEHFPSLAELLRSNLAGSN